MKQWPPRQAMRERLIVQGGEPDMVKHIIQAHAKHGMDAANARLNTILDELETFGRLVTVEQTPYMTAIMYLSDVCMGIVATKRLVLVPMSNAQWN